MHADQSRTIFILYFSICCRSSILFANLILLGSGYSGCSCLPAARRTLEIPTHWTLQSWHLYLSSPVVSLYTVRQEIRSALHKCFSTVTFEEHSSPSSYVSVTIVHPQVSHKFHLSWTGIVAEVMQDVVHFAEELILYET